MKIKRESPFGPDETLDLQDKIKYDELLSVNEAAAEENAAVATAEDEEAKEVADLEEAVIPEEKEMAKEHKTQNPQIRRNSHEQ